MHACRLVSSQLNVGLVPLYAVYLGAAAAVEHYSKAASKEFAHRRISVNCVAPVWLFVDPLPKPLLPWLPSGSGPAAIRGEGPVRGNGCL